MIFLVIKDLELQKLILRALKWTEAGKTIDQQLDRLRNASFRAVLNNPDLLRDEDLVQLLGPYLHQPTDVKPSGIEYNAKLMDDSVTEMEVGVDPDLFFPYDEDDTKSLDVEVTKVVKPKKERKKSDQRKQQTNKKITLPNTSSSVTITPQIVTSPVKTEATTSISPGKIRVKPEAQLFNTTTIGQTTIIPETITIPKPIIVVPTPVQSKSKQSKAKFVEEVPSIQIIPEPRIVTTTTTPQPVIQVPASSKSQNESKKVTAQNAKNQTKVETVSVAKSSSSSVQSPTVESTSSTTTSSNEKPAPTPKSTKTKKETKSRPQIRIKLDTGPKTRARSVFSARHKCGVCGKKFSTSGNLKAHVKTHKPKGKFNCDKCGRV